MKNNWKPSFSPFTVPIREVTDDKFAGKAQNLGVREFSDLLGVSATNASAGAILILRS